MDGPAGRIGDGARERPARAVWLACELAQPMSHRRMLRAGRKGEREKEMEILVRV